MANSSMAAPKFSSLQTILDLAALLGTTQKRLLFNLYSSKRPPYTTFAIRKASGGQRAIASPPKPVVVWQRQILEEMTTLVRPKANCHGFTAGRNVRSNAEPHKGASLVLNIDLLEFFPRIHFGRVRGIFLKGPFNFPVKLATVLAQLCCNGRWLPTGAPTSPLIANLICRTLDDSLSRLSRRASYRYTRYADDITFSTQESSFPSTMVTIEGSKPRVGDGIAAILKKNDLQSNPNKIRLRTRFDRQEVTGLIVNEKINVSKEYVRNIRAILHNCAKRGIPAAQQEFDKKDKKQRLRQGTSVISHIAGKLAYMRMIKGADDPLYVKYALELARLVQPTREVSVWGRAAQPLGLLRESLWVVLGYDKRGQPLFNGTAFALQNIGFVTARHLFEQPSLMGPGFEVSRWVLIDPSASNASYPVTSIAFDKQIDITVVKTTAKPRASLLKSAVPTNQGEALRVVGFPKWRSGDPPADATGLFLQPKRQSLIDYLLTNLPIREGISGGPVLNQDGKVVGVAHCDANNPTLPNSAVCIKHLGQVVAGPPTRVPL